MAYSNDTGYASVTDILKHYIDTDFFTQECAERGTAVHECCEAYVKKNWIMPILPPNWRPYFQSFKKWADEYLDTDNVILTEKRLVCHKEKFTGKLDFVGYIKGSRTAVLLDWKTGQAVENWWKLQLAAYKYLIEKNEESSNIPRRIASVRLKKDGTGCLVNYYLDNYKTLLAQFLKDKNEFYCFN